MKKNGKISGRLKQAGLVGAILVGASTNLYAADWSDTSIGWRYGNKFAEPFEGNDITKNILNMTHVSGYKYGTNFFNVDILLSNSKDPSAIGSTDGAREVYIVYRHTLALGKMTGKSYKAGIARDFGLTFGFDANVKTDTGYNSKKQMLVLGPTVMLDVPGFMDVSLLALWESNQPSGWNFGTNSTYSLPRYNYDVHPMLTAAWGIPIGASAFSFEGFVNFIASKGKDEFGNETKPETNFDGQIMADIGKLTGGAKGVFKLGLEYQYWKNKFGNDPAVAGGSGTFAKTPMIRAEYHF